MGRQRGAYTAAKTLHDTKHEVESAQIIVETDGCVGCNDIYLRYYIYYRRPLRGRVVSIASVSDSCRANAS